MGRDVQPSSGKQVSITCNCEFDRQMTSLQGFLTLLSMTPYGVEYPFGQLGSAAPAVSPFLWTIRADTLLNIQLRQKGTRQGSD